MEEKYSPLEDWSLWIYPDSQGKIINSENYQEELEKSELIATPETIRNGVIDMNIFNSVFLYQ